MLRAGMAQIFAGKSTIFASESVSIVGEFRDCPARVTPSWHSPLVASCPRDVGLSHSHLSAPHSHWPPSSPAGRMERAMERAAQHRRVAVRMELEPAVRRRRVVHRRPAAQCPQAAPLPLREARVRPVALEPARVPAAAPRQVEPAPAALQRAIPVPLRPSRGSAIRP